MQIVEYVKIFLFEFSRSHIELVRKIVVGKEKKNNVLFYWLKVNFFCLVQHVRGKGFNFNGVQIPTSKIAVLLYSSILKGKIHKKLKLMKFIELIFQPKMCN